MTEPLTNSRLANLGANDIFKAFVRYRTEFSHITRRAKARFEMCDWQGTQVDALERLDLYRKIVDEIVAQIRQLLKDKVNEKLVWAGMKAVYTGLLNNRDDWEVAETFFNSVTRRLFATVGVDPQMEFVHTDYGTPPIPTRRLVYRTYGARGSLERLIEAILADYPFEVAYQDQARDIARMAEEIEAQLASLDLPPVIERIEMLKPVFYRGKAAYLVGRMFCGDRLIPLVLALLNNEDGLFVDAVLLDEDGVSILFSFTRSYFHVEADRPYDFVHFLKSMLPRKRVAELYISLGFNKHGKTELYRDLLHHLAHSDDRFEIAPGERGMVMSVFTLANYDVVFKIIKDQFDYPKTTTRDEVMDKYRLVFKHDRAGRLIDAQEFEHLKFYRHRFSPEALAELQEVASQTIEVDPDHVIIKHAYVERRVTPLNLYVRQVDEEAARAAVIDYGKAIKDLMVTNVFPGDLLLKNFGVTRHERVVFYDYDELCLLTDCRFRKMPPARNFEDEFAAESWFTPDENDIFPEEFRHFLGLPDDLEQVFIDHHADLFEAKFWRGIQKRLKNGEVIHIFPYKKKLAPTAE